MADAYKVKADTSIPRVVRESEEFGDETVGQNYVAGSYVLASEMPKALRERAEAGELDHLLESASAEDAEQYRLVQRQGEFGVFIPEHEAERVALERHGHTVVPRAQAIRLNSAGAEGASAALEAAKEEELDARPNLTAKAVNIADVSRGDVEVTDLPEGVEEVSEEELHGVEQPPGLPVGAVQEEAKSGEAGRRAVKRARPQRAGQTTQDSKEGQAAQAEETAQRSGGRRRQAQEGQGE